MNVYQEKTKQNKPQQISRLKMLKQSVHTGPKKGQPIYDSYDYSTRKTNIAPEKKKRCARCLSTPSRLPPLKWWTPPLRPFHVKGIKGTRSTSRWFPSPYEHRSYFVHPISLRSAIGKFPCTFFWQTLEFPTGTWPRGSSNVKVWCHNSTKKTTPKFI